jgi:transposase
MIHSEEFKKAAVQKFLNRGNRSADEIIKETGIHPSTIYKWCSQFANVKDMKKSTKPKNRSVAEKLKALTEYQVLPLENRGEYLRKNGLYEENIIEWQKIIEEAFTPVKKTAKERFDQMADQRKIKSLEKELHRKEKALAEAAALIILKKKADLIWGLAEEE